MNPPSQQSYWTDDYLYAVYRLVNVKKFAQKNLIDFEYLRPPKQQTSSFWFYLVTKLVPETGITLDGLIFHKDLYKQYSPEDFDKMLKRTEKESILKKVFKNEFDFKDLLNLPLSQASMFNWFEFSANLPEETQKKLSNYLNEYIKNYIGEKLKIDKENVPIFSRQKADLDLALWKEKSTFGNSFVFNHSNVVFFSHNLFFAHNLIAYEQQKLLTVEDFYIIDYDKDPAEQQEQYNAKITILPKYSEEHEEKQKVLGKHLGLPEEDKIKEIINEIEKRGLDINVVISNLNRRFQGLVEHRKPDIFNLLMFDYVNYAGRTKIISKVIEKLVLEDRIERKTYIDLLIYFLGSTVGQDDLKHPLFLTKKTEEKFNTQDDVTAFFKNELKELDEAKSTGKRFFDPSELIDLPIEDDLYFIRKLHNDILEELSNLNQPRVVTKEIADKAVYIVNDGTLSFKGIALKFNRKYNQKDLLATLFKEPQKNWYYDEIQEDWDKTIDISGLPKDYWRKFYTAGDEINKQVAIETGVKDFIVKNTKQLRINQKYI